MQIVEINNSPEKESQEELVLGIDFGTTNSLIAISENYKAKVIAMPDGKKVVPSIIGWDDDLQSIKIGDKDSGKQSIRSIKRLLAKSSAEISANEPLRAIAKDISLDKEEPKVLFKKAESSLNKTNGENAEQGVSLTQLASYIFKHLKNGAQSSLNKEIKKVVVSVPAYFDDGARGQIMLAAKLAGLEVIRLIAEPTAAAYAYGLNKKQEGSYLVYDLGGGTFDVSILNMHQGVLQVVATGGNSMLGGDDIDYTIARYLSNRENAELTNGLINAAKELKHQLTDNPFAKIDYSGKEIVLDNAEFEDCTQEIVDKSLQIAKQVLMDAEDVEIDGIILVGGSTRTPLIKRRLEQEFKVKIYDDLDPDCIVALGSAMQAENLSCKSNYLLIDVLPLSVGLELYGGLTEKIIMRNTPIPFSVTKEFTTHVDNQTGMKFHILQGEREMVEDCRSLAKFELSGITPDKAGRAKIEVVFSIDTDGVLSVTARDALTSKAHNIEIKPSYGISENQVNDLIEDAFMTARQDFEARNLQETRLEAKEIIAGIEKALLETPDILNENEALKIKNAIKALQDSINLDNRDSILSKVEILNNHASDFIQKHLDKGVELHLKGKKIDNLKI